MGCCLLQLMVIYKMLSLLWSTEFIFMTITNTVTTPAKKMVQREIKQ